MMYDSDTSDDEEECALLMNKSKIQTFKPHSYEIIDPPKSLRADPHASKTLPPLILKIPKAPTSAAATSKDPKTPTSKPETSKVSKTPKSKRATSKAPTSRASTTRSSAPASKRSRPSTPKASTSRASTSEASTSRASTPEASTSRASTSRESSRVSRTAQSKGKTLPGTSEDSSEHQQDFWRDTLKNKFMTSAYADYMLNSGFTKAQAESIQNQLYESVRENSNFMNNSDRVKRAHTCNKCEFKVYHQCVPVSFLHYGMGFGNLDRIIEPDQPIICICDDFAFFHAHTKDGSRALAVKPVSSEAPDTKPLRKHFIIGLSCSFCDIVLMIQHPSGRKNENKLNVWSLIESDHERTFYNAIVAHLKNLRDKEPSLTEMFRCTNGCCLLFHRCAD